MPLTTGKRLSSWERCWLIQQRDAASYHSTFARLAPSSLLSVSLSFQRFSFVDEIDRAYISIWHRWQGSKGEESRLTDEWSKRDEIVIVDPGLRDWKEVIDDRGYLRAANATERMNCWKLCWHIVRHRIGSKVGVINCCDTFLFFFFWCSFWFWNRAINSYRVCCGGSTLRNNAV